MSSITHSEPKTTVQADRIACNVRIQYSNCIYRGDETRPQISLAQALAETPLQNPACAAQIKRATLHENTTKRSDSGIVIVPRSAEAWLRSKAAQCTPQTASCVFCGRHVVNLRTSSSKGSLAR